MDNQELATRMRQVEEELTKLRQQKIELNVKKEAIQEKVDELRPQVQEAFETTDSEELLKKRAAFLEELEAIEL